MFIERRDDHILLLLGKVRIGSKRDLKYPHVPEISVQISRQRQHQTAWSRKYAAACARETRQLPACAVCLWRRSRGRRIHSDNS